jgi:hypothetical protein
VEVVSGVLEAVAVGPTQEAVHLEAAVEYMEEVVAWAEAVMEEDLEVADLAVVDLAEAEVHLEAAEVNQVPVVQAVAELLGEALAADMEVVDF